MPAPCSVDALHLNSLLALQSIACPTAGSVLLGFRCFGAGSSSPARMPAGAHGAVCMRASEQVFERVPVQPRDAREASDVFYKQGQGDVLLNYENEVIFTNRQYPPEERLPYIVPDHNIRVRGPCVCMLACMRGCCALYTSGAPPPPPQHKPVQPLHAHACCSRHGKFGAACLCVLSPLLCRCC